MAHTFLYIVDIKVEYGSMPPIVSEHERVTHEPVVCMAFHPSYALQVSSCFLHHVGHTVVCL